MASKLTSNDSNNAADQGEPRTIHIRHDLTPDRLPPLGLLAASAGTRAVSMSRKIFGILAACSTRRPDFPKAITHPGSTMKRTTFPTITTVVVV